MKNKYTLTIRYEFEAADDPEARQIVHDRMTGGGGSLWTAKKKLQRVHENKQPDKVELPDGW